MLVCLGPSTVTCPSPSYPTLIHRILQPHSMPRHYCRALLPFRSCYLLLSLPPSLLPPRRWSSSLLIVAHRLANARLSPRLVSRCDFAAARATAWAIRGGGAAPATKLLGWWRLRPGCSRCAGAAAPADLQFRVRSCPARCGRSTGFARATSQCVDLHI